MKQNNYLLIDQLVLWECRIETASKTIRDQKEKRRKKSQTILG